MTAGAKRELVHQKGDGYVIQVKEEATRNLANVRVRELLAREMQVPIGKVQFVSGQRSRVKRFEISR